ncbi:MAG: hypothetical protein M3P06_00660 [Acidobacteriota bacterium]|nr:hypothetical protein [Acidobacteriota bacterium]
MRQLPVLGIFIMLLACDLNPAAKAPIAAAHAVTRQFAKQRLRAEAAGEDCMVLLIRTKTGFDDALVESIHYGVDEYDAYRGGIQHFAETKGFRAVVYRDASDGLWTYGSIALDEAKALPTCR